MILVCHYCFFFGGGFPYEVTKPQARTQSRPLFVFPFGVQGSLLSPFEPKRGTRFIPRLLLGLDKGCIGMLPLILTVLTWDYSTPIKGLGFRV